MIKIYQRRVVVVECGYKIVESDKKLLKKIKRKKKNVYTKCNGISEPDSIAFLYFSCFIVFS